MKLPAIEIIVGLLLLPVTIFLGYLYLISLNEKGNFLFLGLAIVLGCVEVYCLFRGTNPKEKKDSLEPAPAFAASIEKDLKGIEDAKSTKQPEVKK